MTDPTEFDFDFDVKEPGSEPEGGPPEREAGEERGGNGSEREGNGRKRAKRTSFDPDADSGNGRASRSSESERNGGRSSRERSSDGKRDGSKAKASKKAKAGSKPKAGKAAEPTPLSARRRERGSEGEDPGESGESFEEILERSSKPNGGARSLGGIQLPTMPDVKDLGSEISERIRSFKAPDFSAFREGGLKDGFKTLRESGLRRGGGGPPRIGGRRIPFRSKDPDERERRGRGRVKKGRLLIILSGIGLLAMVSTIFGMMMAVSSDLPQLENKSEYIASQNSVVYDYDGNKIGTLTPNNNRILVESDDIAQSMKQAAVAIEDERFYEHRGVDFVGIARAAVVDVIPGGSTQGASTITQQFAKNALEAQSSRTVFQKLREASIAYHLERQWDKDKILTQYLNTIYFGEGAYGIEAAARTYFGTKHPDCGEDGQPRCASELLPHESAMLAGIISAPSAYSPRSNPEDAMGRRNLVLKKMQEQGFLTESDYADYSQEAIPSASEILPPKEDSVSPYFTSWLRQQLVDKFGAGKAFGGGLRIKTSIDLDLQESLEGIVSNVLAPVVPTGSIVVIDNKTGAVRGMVGGLDYEEHPFNLATNGHRQPGSAFKPFTLVAALENGHSPSETYSSSQGIYTVPNSGGKETFELHNYDDIYYGALDIATATAKSDNNVYMQLGYNIINNSKWKDSRDAQESFNEIEATANKMGIQTDVTGDKRANPAMVLGGLIDGVTPLEMAYAFSTLARGGERLSGTLATDKGGPVAMLEIKDKEGKKVAENKAQGKQVIDESTASTATSILSGVLSSGGTGRRAITSGADWGKTGTTDNNGDAWFCGAAGGADGMTACVWVGHADSTEPMETEFAGEPVDGGTYPALMWAQVVSAWNNIEAAREEGTEDPSTGTTSGGYVPPAVSGSSEGADGPATTGGDGGGGGAPSQAAPAPAPAGGGSSGGIGAGL